MLPKDRRQRCTSIIQGICWVMHPGVLELWYGNPSPTHRRRASRRKGRPLFGPAGTWAVRQYPVEAKDCRRVPHPKLSVLWSSSCSPHSHISLLAVPEPLEAVRPSAPQVCVGHQLHPNRQQKGTSASRARCGYVSTRPTPSSESVHSAASWPWQREGM